MASPHKKRAEMQKNTLLLGSTWGDMAPDVLANIFTRLSLQDFISVIPCVCKPWMHASLHPLSLPILDLGDLPFQATDRLLQVLLRRTEPHLREFVFPHMNHPDWLKVVEKSAPVLQKLHIPYSCASNEWAINVAPLMTRITYLHVSTSEGVQLSQEALEAFGKHCRHITHLRRNEEGLRWVQRQIMCDCSSKVGGPPINDDSAAFAIAQNYPSLKHLELRNNLLSKLGLRAILDGCPMLEHLDLTGCVLDMDVPLLMECRTRLCVFLEASYEEDDDDENDGSDNDSDEYEDDTDTDEASTDDDDGDDDDDDDDDDEDDDFEGLLPEIIGKPVKY